MNACVASFAVTNWLNPKKFEIFIFDHSINLRISRFTGWFEKNYLSDDKLVIDSIYLSRRSESFLINIPYCHQHLPVFDLFTDYLTPIRQEGYCIPVYWTHFSIISALRRENLDKDSSWNVRMFQCLTVKNNFNRVNYIILIICLILTYSMKTEWHSYQNIGHVIQLNLSTQVVIQWNWRIVTHR